MTILTAATNLGRCKVDDSDDLSEFALLSIKSLQACITACETALKPYVNAGIASRAIQFAEGITVRDHAAMLAHSLWELEEVKKRIGLVRQGYERGPLEFTHLWVKLAHVSTCLVVVGAAPYIDIKEMMQQGILNQ